MNTFTVPLVKRSVDCTHRVPGSKSITNRAFLLAGLANGISVLKYPLKSDDTKYMKEALIQLGIQVEEADTSFTVHGTGGKFSKGEKTLYLGNAGTATRFLTAAMALRNDISIIDGNARMRERPLKDLIEALRSLGAIVESETLCPPVRVQGGNSLKSHVQVRGDISSQYISALMHIGPLFSQGLTIETIGTVVSKPYIDITIQVMKQFGAEVINKNYERLTIPSGQYMPQHYTVEGDASAASYFWGLAALTGGTVTLTNIPADSCQGDVHFTEVLEKMGCRVDKTPQGISVTGPKTLKGLGTINMNAMPDVAMTLAVLASQAEGETIITDVANMRVKETDRIFALVTEMRKLGIDAEELPDGIIIRGGGKRNPASIATYDDHRMAMCFGMLGTVVEGITIEDPECCSKTYPHFFEDLIKCTQ